MVVFLNWVTAFFCGVHVCFVWLCVTKSYINWKMSLYCSANMLNDVWSVKVSKDGWHNNFRVDHRLFPLPFFPRPSLKEDMGFCGTSCIVTPSCRGTRCPPDSAGLAVCPGCRKVQWQPGTSASEVMQSLGTRQQLCGRQEAWGRHGKDKAMKMPWEKAESQGVFSLLTLLFANSV